MKVIKQARELATNPAYAQWLALPLLVADSILCGLIIFKVPYTEIDWVAYMEQIKIYLAGERDYTKIQGSTGPLVYPAGHLRIYRLLYAVTDGGKNVLLAQVLFAVLYIATLALVMACYRRARAPPYIFPMLVFSKRLHSIYMLRLFNDGFAVFALFLAIYAYQRHSWMLGSAFYSFAVSVKMSVLLALPAVGVILLQGDLLGRFFSRSLTHFVIMSQVQIVLALPFLNENATGYLSRAFDLTRQFLYKWTVNWRFVPEDIFLSKPFSTVLLGINAGLVLLFARARWMKPSGSLLYPLPRMVITPPAPEVQQFIAQRVTPQFILTTILTCNAIGMLCARSLHYQFFAWLAWGTPFLLWRTGYHPVIIYAIWGAQEWAWNVYPSTQASSKVVVGALLVTIAGVWDGTRKDLHVAVRRRKEAKSEAQTE
ncbi:MAG: hypothetical protein M1825_002494 [Sarcosagium campestre]|nr:MAG: hypothetical protein M1825_002494 [Sarcosagium campestre]